MRRARQGAGTASAMVYEETDFDPGVSLTRVWRTPGASPAHVWRRPGTSLALPWRQSGGRRGLAKKICGRVISFASRARTIARMESESKHLEALLVSLRRNEKRSPLFHWLAKHHDEILQALAGERIDWRTAVARFREAGLTDATGKPPTPRTARETWYQVRRLIAARMAGPVSSRPVKIIPSKMSKDARPSVGPSPVAPAVPPSAAVTWPTAQSVGQVPPQSDPARGRRLSAAERTEELMQQLQSRKY